MGLFQPQWETTYIDVLDLPCEIVELLVDLAYDGEMRLDEEMKDSVFDAMEMLGWVRTSALSSHYVGVGECNFRNGPPTCSQRRECFPHRQTTLSSRNMNPFTEDGIELNNLPTFTEDSEGDGQLQIDETINGMEEDIIWI